MKRVALTFGVLLLLTAPGFATSLLWMDLQDLTLNSTAVVRGRIVAQSNLTDEPGISLNRVTVEINETFKGKIKGTVVLQNPGFAGAPEFTDGDEVILFIHTRDGTHVLTGFHQGSFKVICDDLGQKVLDRGIPSRDKSLAGTHSVEALVSEILAAAE